eukprot:CAMPEP_0172297516 /NCGR_PEP_ID=MMETSP1058-20130122/507_1 /TAXON_ID=83371 /ORGANISM="Detonula confervacea, Strain CCMP 353" /LENGTH=175 /DNA_ID=CAMNT_0013006677 /DNA_START=48 /DNA_END=575 /DNA_ORIENTATION=+
MNTFTKTVFLVLAASSASAQNLKGSAAATTRNLQTNLPYDECVDDERPRPVRSGDRYRFNLMDSDAQCADANSDLYEYGEFNNAKDSSACAKFCVNEVNDYLAGELLGFDFDCREQTCRCLYSRGTLDGQRSYSFQRTNTRLQGEGGIEKTRSKTEFFCFRLVGTELLEDATAEA